MGYPIRGEMWNLALMPEVTYGTDISGATYYTWFPGVFQNVSVPDPVMEFNPFYMLGINSYRNWYVAYKGKMTLSGGIPEMLLLNGTSLYLPIGLQTTFGQIVGGDSARTAVACSRGDVIFGVSALGSLAAGDNIQLNSSAIGASSPIFGPEVRQVVSVSAATSYVAVTKPLMYNHPATDKAYKVSGTYYHVVTESVNLESVGMHVTIADTTQTNKLMRRFNGGKVGRASLSAREGEYLTFSLEDLNFIRFTTDQTSAIVYYNSTMINPSPVYPSTEPYLFSYGSLALNGTVFARIRGFRLEISNNLQPKYYVTQSGQTQLPYEYREGQRQYRCSVDIDIEDASLYRELLLQGTYTNVYKGFSMALNFTRGTNDAIYINSPAGTSPITSPGTPGTPAVVGNAMGCLIQNGKHDLASNESITHVTLDIIVRSIGIVIVDSLGYLPE